ARDLILVIDGYVIDGPSSPYDRAEVFRSGGAAGLEELDGSFVILAIEPGARRLVVVNDRAGSRPLFTASNIGVNAYELLLGPELKCFRAELRLRGEIEPAAMPSMLLNSYLLDTMTYWSNVSALPPAMRFEFSADSARQTRYWAPPFRNGHAPGAATVADTASEAIIAHCRQFASPAIALSGGVDSRLMLAAARRAELNLPVITWSYLERETPGSDMETAGRVARRLELK